ncbi:MAG: UDP-glucose/GDP-mannose dehydrogenase family protein [Deltaproteobacteria bacterium]|nr:UDP-glucose/GDP-mannose dehydrogenase family protein [Deltaproteobacteria bacterium]
MKICIFGSGYVGLVAGTCFSESGNEVICVDVDNEKVELLNKGICPIYEPGLEEMVKRNIRQKRLSFSTDAEKAVRDSSILFIAVGTPQDEDGSADLQYVLKVAETIGIYINEPKIIVDKSTVPVGTADLVRKCVQEQMDKRSKGFSFDVVSNPEFLKEGEAINDFMNPDRVVIGTDTPEAGRVMKDLYMPFMNEEDRLLLMDIRSAEMTKYAANSLLATKISFMNEIANLCEKLGANVDQVRTGIGSDSRIGPSFLFPGVGYGGSCFPKDVQAMIRMGKQSHLAMELLNAVEKVNLNQKSRLPEMIQEVYGDSLEGLTFGVWGLSFKPKTDDMREAPSIVIIKTLLEKGARIVASDPAALEEAQRTLGDKIEYRDYYYDVLQDADALVIITEWNDYRRPDFERMKQLLKKPVIFDGRNMFDPQKMESRGFKYHSIGRPAKKG